MKALQHEPGYHGQRGSVILRVLRLLVIPLLIMDATAWKPNTTSATSVTPPGNTLEDTFMRANQTGWGTSANRDGVPNVAWGLNGDGTQPFVTISSNTGIYGYPRAINLVGIASAGSAVYNGGDDLVRFSLSRVGHVTPYVVQNACPGTGCYYGARLHTSQNRLELAKRSGGVTTMLASVPFTASANVTYWMRLDVIAGTRDTLQAKIWADGSPEPRGWLVAVIDPAPLAANYAGAGGTWDYPGTGESIRYTCFAYASSGLASQCGASPVVGPTAAPAFPTPTTQPASRAPRTAHPAMATATPVSAPAARTVALGAWVPGSPWDGGSALDAFAALVGARPAIDMWYENWVQNGFTTSNYNAVSYRGETPMISWGSCNGNTTVGGNVCSDAAIADGIADSYLHRWARAAAAWGKPFLLRLDWEMNGGWYGWSPSQNGNTAADFVNMWRHVHDIFVAEGATNVKWVWCPNTMPTGSDFKPLYPDDAYVDYVGLDGYNWGSSQTWSTWHSFTQDFLTSYQYLESFTSKPVIIGETASSEIGGNKAAWITSAYLTEIPSSFPNLVAVVWFDEDKEQDWRVNSSSGALAAYQQAVAAPMYQVTPMHQVTPPPQVYPTASPTPSVSPTAVRLQHNHMRPD